MPELPDVAGFKKYLDSTSLHQPVARTSILDRRILDGPSPKGLGGKLKGETLEATRRHGKFLFALTDAGSGAGLVLHFGMTGELAYFQGQDDPPEYTTVLLQFESGGNLAYICKRMLGRVTWTDDVDAFIADEDLGPDALSDDLTRDKFTRRLDGRRGAIKPALMNQAIIAGVGNIYADEICFQAHVHPASKIPDLKTETLQRIHRQMRRILKLAADRGGRIESYPRTWLLSARHRGTDTCPRCDSKLKTTTVSGRTTHYCPGCQGD
jgi:formamidopyrimidine-DNA glycosylase